MKTAIDIHNHTIASGHAFSTVQEMAHAAAEKGIEYLGITDHGPAVPGTCDPVYFRNYPCVPQEMYGVKLLMGCEVNILNAKGDLDWTNFIMALWTSALPVFTASVGLLEQKKKTPKAC